MKRLLPALICAATLAFVAQAALAVTFTTYPPGPGGACPDTLSINQLKTRLDTGGACSPNDRAPGSSAPGDTILGVGGIITGFDEIPTGFDLYIQTTGGGPRTGIDVFTHGTNMRPVYGFNRGDSIVVEYAGVANFQGDVELEAPNNLFSNPNIVLRKVNTGNTLPPFFTGTTTDLKELPTNTTFAPYVSALVHLNGPVRVARTVGLSFHAMLVVSDAATSDSVFVDYAKMTNIVPPPVGTVITSIQGIGNLATRGFRIMPRDGDDIVDLVAPSITDAYAVADNKYRVVYDRSVTSGTATNTGNYTLGSFGNVDAAVMDGTSAVILTVSGTGLLHGQSETVQVNGITGVNNGVTMTTPQSLFFLAGVQTCGEMSQPNPDTLAAIPCVDKPLYSGPGGEFLNGGFGTRSTFTGVVVAQYGNLYYMEDGFVDPATNQIHSRGITVFAPPIGLLLGHCYTIAGACEDFWQEAEFAAIVYVQDNGFCGTPSTWSIDPAVMALGDPCDATQSLLTPRDYLSDLVKLSRVKVVQYRGNTLSNGKNIFYVAGPQPSFPDTIKIENQNNALGAYSAANVNYPAVGKIVDIIGVMHFTNNPAAPNDTTNAGTFRICPRTGADITILGPTGVGGGVPLELSLSAFPNPARSVNLSFALPRATNVELNVYDLFGRKVAQVASGAFGAGIHTKAWDGTDLAGNKVHSGLYYYRLRAGNEVRTARTVLIGN
jgi:FlgD Ig-like domain